MFKPATQLDPTKPEPGAYVGVSRSAYRSLRLCNHSSLREMQSSPFHAYHEWTKPSKSHTEATRLGAAAHIYVLSREDFPRLVHVEPTWGEDRRCTYELNNPGIEACINSDQLAKIVTMSKAVGKHPIAAGLRTSPGHCEVVLVWDDPSGVRCKAAIDKVVLPTEQSPVYWRPDFKTTESVDTEDFEKSILKFGYATQDAFYSRGWEVLGLPECYSALIAVEKKPPHGCRVFQFDDETARVAGEFVNAWLATWAACEKSGQWPDSPGDIEQIGFPAWYLRRHTQEALS
jgi:hypothetical protein